MSKDKSNEIEFINLAKGAYWLAIKAVNLRILCGVPPDVVKYLAAHGLTKSYMIDGQYAEYGPNSLLLSEDLFLNGLLANQAEFPILQMFYMQGMGVTSHPHFNKERPLIIGTKNRLDSQLDYIRYGNNGLNYQEMSVDTKLDPSIVYLWQDIKARFAGDADFSKLIDHIYVEKMLEIKPEVILKRVKYNCYTINYKDKVFDIDLNLAKNETFETTYELKKCSLPKATFAVVNTGTGDGWNQHQPCFSSMLINKTTKYLIDCEVFFQKSLKSFGLVTADLKGIFMTHSHDDHMSGLPILYNAGESITIYATALIYKSIMTKLKALVETKKQDIKKIFILHELEYEKWNKVGELEVMPLHSAHPVETSIFFFRVKDTRSGEYKTYAHLGDIAPLSVIKRFRSFSITDDERYFYNQMIKNYLAQVDLKKIDVGGGMIHGIVQDFKNDSSKKIILGHYHRTLKEEDLKIGVEQDFGDYDILIK